MHRRDWLKTLTPGDEAAVTWLHSGMLLVALVKVSDVDAEHIHTAGPFDWWCPREGAQAGMRGNGAQLVPIDEEVRRLAIVTETRYAVKAALESAPPEAMDEDRLLQVAVALGVLPPELLEEDELLEPQAPSPPSPPLPPRRPGILHTLRELVRGAD